jgi:hypothetical protein
MGYRQSGHHLAEGLNCILARLKIFKDALAALMLQLRRRR